MVVLDVRVSRSPYYGTGSNLNGRRQRMEICQKLLTENPAGTKVAVPCPYGAYEGENIYLYIFIEDEAARARAAYEQLKAALE